jgi:hypothetical protein
MWYIIGGERAAGIPSLTIHKDVSDLRDCEPTSYHDRGPVTAMHTNTENNQSSTLLRNLEWSIVREFPVSIFSVFTILPDNRLNSQ